MNQTDKPRFARVLLAFAELKGKKITAAAVDLYWQTMSHWSIDAFESAAAHLLRSSEYFPVPVDFERLRKAGQLQAGEAWALVLEHIRSGGYRYGRADELPPEVNRAIAAVGGWMHVATADKIQHGMIERAFLKHFDELADVAEIRAHLPQIAPTPALALTDGRGPRTVDSLAAGILDRLASPAAPPAGG